MITTILAKTLLSPVKPGLDNWFGLRYNLNLYRGCQHGCIYCDSRSTCYGIKDFSDIQVKGNAPELLEREIRSKRQRGTIGFGSMNDPYMPVEKDRQLTRQALEIISRHRFPVHLITKSNLVTRDIDLLLKISKVYAAVSITVTTSDDTLSREIEPGAPVSADRFRAIQELSAAGIYCGVLLMPVLPYLTDQPSNIREVIYLAREAGARYVLGSMGMTLRDGQRDYFYFQLDKKFPGLREKYVSTYGDRYSCHAPNQDLLQKIFNTSCLTVNLPQRMAFYHPDNPRQGILF